MRRILIIEDDGFITDVLRVAMEADAFEVDVAAYGARGLEMALAQEWDAVILDLGLPDMSGLEVCRRLRAQSPVPILIVTARGEETDRVAGLEAGADDYLVKPFSTAELGARVRAILRRRDLDRLDPPGDPSTPLVLHVGELTIDIAARTVSADGAHVHLTNSEFELLMLLAERPGEAVSREAIVQRLWSSDFVGDTRVCDTYVSRLRKKIENHGERHSRISTVRGFGYRLEAE